MYFHLEHQSSSNVFHHFISNSSFVEYKYRHKNNINGLININFY